MSQKQYDVIIVGAGMGGLITGAILAGMEGRKVLILEKNSEIGGRLMSFGKQHGSDYTRGKQGEECSNGTGQEKPHAYLNNTLDNIGATCPGAKVVLAS